MTETATDPIRKSITVPLDRATAFDLFTKDIDKWWPKDSHSLTASAGKGTASNVRLEPKKGGRVIETKPDGTEADWATITAWKPGEHFAMHWYVGRSPDEATLVDVHFTQTEAGTRVDLTHSGFDVLGAAADTTCAGYTTGWDHVFGRCYRGACDKVAV